MPPIDVTKLLAQREESRAHKVECLKQSVETNQYDVCPSLIAEGIIREIILDVIALKSLTE